MRKNTQIFLISACVILLLLRILRSVDKSSCTERILENRDGVGFPHEEQRFEGRVKSRVLAEYKTSGQLVGNLRVITDTHSAPSFDKIRLLNGIPLTDQGDHGRCDGRNEVAILIPFRGRELHLRLLLHHLYPILRRQRISYTIYVITQTAKGLFNRAKLFNIGIKKASQDCNFNCFIFHDTDLLLEDDRCMYRCHKRHPVHLSKYVNIYGYIPLNYSVECPPTGFPNVLRGFGGVSAMTIKQVYDVNGYSNKYWGWGGEDDDMIIRLWKKGYDAENLHLEYCSYTMIRHEREDGNSLNQKRYKLLHDSIRRMETDGLNSVKYDVISVERHPLFVNVTVDVGTGSEDTIYVAGQLADKCKFTEQAYEDNS